MEYPFVYPLDPQVAVGDWIKNNLANCRTQGGFVNPSYQQFYNIDKNIDIEYDLGLVKEALPQLPPAYQDIIIMR